MRLRLLGTEVESKFGFEVVDGENEEAVAERVFDMVQASIKFDYEVEGFEDDATQQAFLTSGGRVAEC